MSERNVNVLAVLDKHIKAERALGYEASAREGENAHVAMNGLIKALREIEKVCEGQARGIVVHIDKIAHDALASIGETL